jgi:molybdopterin synthase catalytic subunit
LQHRTGTVKAGETAVIAAVSATHRKPAFESCQFLMDELKRSVPIWKKEVYADGSHWVSPTP